MRTSARPPARQRGVALITAVLTVAIATIMAADMLWRSHLDQRRAQSALSGEQSWLYQRGAELLAAEVLGEAAQAESHHLGQFWAQPMQGLAIDGGTLSGWLEDLQGRFNLNNLIHESGLVDEDAVLWFQRLLLLLELDPALAAYVADWIDLDSDPLFPVGAEDDVYTARTPPYRPPNLPLTSSTELLAIEGFNADVYDRLETFVAALPVGTALNVNTAPPELLASLGAGMTLADGQALIELRGDADFPNFQATFSERLEPAMMDRIDERSRFFRLTTRIEVGDHQWTLYTLLRREENEVIRPLFRSMGTH